VHKEERIIEGRERIKRHKEGQKKKSKNHQQIEKEEDCGGTSHTQLYCCGDTSKVEKKRRIYVFACLFMRINICLRLLPKDQ
jgi:hypothetical protein